MTPNAASKTYGAADPTFTGTLTGFLAADGVTATYSRTAGESVAGSPYTISATLSPAGVLGNYTITYDTASFTITPAVASVTPNAASKTYGDGGSRRSPARSAASSPADGVTATYSRTAGEIRRRQPVYDQRDAQPGERARATTPSRTTPRASPSPRPPRR